MDIFILGIERSATTWVSNILEAHPKTSVFMEPLSIYTSRFKKWPNRFEQLDDLSYSAEVFKREFNLLSSRSRFFYTKIFNCVTAWKWDFRLARFISKKFGSTFAQDFLELNFHREGEDFCFLKSKTAKKVIKELRLNFNVPLIKAINPKAKVIVVVRDYAINIKSIYDQISQGNLVELEGLMALEGDHSDYIKLMDYWLKSYNNVIEGLEKAGLDFKLISHKNLLTNTEKEIDSLLGWLELEPSEQVGSYLNFSNSKGYGKHNTKRDHSDLLEREYKARVEIDEIIKGLFDCNEVHPKLAQLL